MNGTQVPNWITPQMKDDAYDPEYEHILKIVPQSRTEVFLKYICMCLGGTSNAALVSSDEFYLVTADDYRLCVKAS